MIKMERSCFSSLLYHRSLYFNPGSMLATVALLACFAVVVMPPLFDCCAKP